MSTERSKNRPKTKHTINEFIEALRLKIRLAASAKRVNNWRDIARDEQIRPSEGVHWLYLAGRGAGKTRSAAERLRERIESGEARYIALIGGSFLEVRNVMVEGESGLKKVAGDLIEVYNRSNGEIRFRGGARAQFFSAEDPDSLRGWQSTDVWGDELCAWRHAQETFDMAMFGLRLGNPEAIWTTTPKNVPVLRELMKDPSCVVTRSTTFANRANLAPQLFDSIIRKYEGTSLGRQELNGELLEDVEGALWQREWFDREGFRLPVALGKDADGRVKLALPPGIIKIIVAIDPSVSDPDRRSNPHRPPDACGLIVAGMDDIGHGYVLADYTAVMSPPKWSRLAVRLYDIFGANGIIAESNQGGELIREMIRGIASNVPVQLVNAAIGKRPRAEPVAGLYEQGRIRHCGVLNDLEDQMLTWDATDALAKSPNNVDALVWAFHGLGLCQATGLRVTHRMRASI